MAKQSIYQKGIAALGGMNYILSVEEAMLESQKKISAFYASMERKGYGIWMSRGGKHYYEKDGKQSQKWKNEYDLIFELTLLAREM